jgi:DNA-binding NarL/FixJ family response regulator
MKVTSVITQVALVIILLAVHTTNAAAQTTVAKQTKKHAPAARCILQPPASLSLMAMLNQSMLRFIISTRLIRFRFSYSDINMPKLNGFELRDKIRTDAALDKKCIPYLFFSTATTQQSVIDAYSMSVQVFFIKQNTIGELQKTVQIIMEYWIRCASPNNVMPAKRIVCMCGLLVPPMF